MNRNFIKSVLIFALVVIGNSVIFSSHASAKNGMLMMPNLIFPQSEVVNDANKLLYYGGPIISKVKVVTLFWNDQVADIIKSELPQFYTEFVNSSQIDWLNEYQTNLKAVDGRDGTNQSFSRGSHLMATVIQTLQRAKSITDEDVQAELQAQIRAGNIPAADSNTLYMIHFPSDMQITIEGAVSCRQFGGYHNAATTKDMGSIFYAVLPDCSAGSLNQDKDQTSAEARLSQATIVASHELIEAVTDPFPTPGDKPAYPQAWNSSNGEEISDLCQWFKGNFKGSKRNYDITKNWSNSRNACFDGN